MKQRSKITGRALILLVLIAASVAETDGAEKVKLTFAYSSTGPTAVGLWVAKDIGAFDK